MKKHGVNIALGIALGAGVGTAIGVATGHLAIWLSVGIAMGTAFAITLGTKIRPLSDKAQKSDVLPPTTGEGK